MASRPPAEHPRPAPVVPLPVPPPRLAVAPLPRPLTTLVGRDREVAAVGALLGLEEVRLLSLTGPGGVGKTRLALAVAEAVAGAFRDGVTFVGLAQVRDPDQVLPTIARALGVREAGGQRLDDLLYAALVGCRLLLVLDNLEQVLDAAPRLAGLLRADPGLTILATSREVLRVSGEQGFPVPPLALADPAAPPPAPGAGPPRAAADPAGAPAVRLFVERAQALRPDFVLDGGNAAVVAEICRRVDGLPLGIELAAARLRHLSAASLLGHLERRLPLLTGGARDLPERQRTLRHTIAWSHDLLRPEEQVLFRRLAVFAGGFTLEAAECVGVPGTGCPLGVVWPVRWRVAGIDVAASVPATRHPPPTTLDLVASLVDKSLLRVEAGVDGETRYLMLETIREYGLERLAASGEEEAIHRRHAATFLALAETARPALTGPEQGRWLERLAADHANLRAALEWGIATGEAATALRLAGALYGFWYVRGHFAEGRGYLDRALAESEAERSPARATALNVAGILAHLHGDHERAVALYDEALALFRGLGDRPGVAAALNNLGIEADVRGDHERAATLYEEALALHRELGHRSDVAGSIDNLGLLARMRGDLAGAAARHEEALALRRELNDRQGIAVSLHGLGAATCVRGDLARAAALGEEALVLYRELGHKRGAADALATLGLVADDQGDRGRAVALLREAVALFQELGQAAGVALCLEGLAATAHAALQPVRASRLYGAAAALREASRAAVYPDECARSDRGVAAARATLGEVAFAAAWEAGRAMAHEEAIAESRALAAAPAESVTLATTGPPAAPPGLTGREIEILRLLAAGESNRAIGARLFISPATVARHVANLYAKLGVDARAKAAAYAHRLGLG